MKEKVTAKKDKMPFWKPLAWSSRAISLSMNTILVGYLTYYCTDMLGLSATVVGTLLLFSKVFDGITDMFVGFIIEKTHTRWGKARPYELFVVGLWIFTVLLFSVPTSMGTTAKCVYIFFMFFLANSICYTFIGGDEAVYLVRAFPNHDHQIQLLSVNGSLVMIVAIVFNIIFPQIINTIGTTASGWTKIAVVMAVPMALLGLLRFVFIKEVVVDEGYKQDKDGHKIKNSRDLSIIEMIRLIFKNKYIWILTGLAFITTFISNMTVVTTYYFKYIVGNIGLQSLPAFANVLTPVIILLFPLLSRKFGTAGILRGGMVLSMIGILIRAFGQTNITTLVVGSALFMVGAMPLSMMIAAYCAETMDYGEWKNGIRLEGPLNLFVGFAQKIGPAIASGVTGLFMGLAGYNGLKEVQSAAANGAIVFLYNWLPVILLVGGIVLAMMWKLGDLMPQIQKDLAEKRNPLD